MANWVEFEKCAGCGWDIGTGEGERGCAWGECAYLPEELDVYCEQCRFNYFSLEGNPACDDPLTCQHAPVPLAHVENYRRWASGRGITLGATLGMQRPGVAREVDRANEAPNSRARECARLASTGPTPHRWRVSRLQFPHRMTSGSDGGA